jgi:hypothetical protein
MFQLMIFSLHELSLSSSVPMDTNLTPREKTFILGSEPSVSAEEQLDRKRFLDNLAVDQRRIARGQPKPFDAIPRASAPGAEWWASTGRRRLALPR